MGYKKSPVRHQCNAIGFQPRVSIRNNERGTALRMGDRYASTPVCSEQMTGSGTQCAIPAAGSPVASISTSNPSCRIKASESSRMQVFPELRASDKLDAASCSSLHPVRRQLTLACSGFKSAMPTMCIPVVMRACAGTSRRTSPRRSALPGRDCPRRLVPSTCCADSWCF